MTIVNEVEYSRLRRQQNRAIKFKSEFYGVGTEMTEIVAG